MKATEPMTANTGANILQLSDVHKKYTAAEVLKGVSFSLKEKEILGIIGPSGGGKSTLLKIMDLLEPFDRGSIEYHILQHNLTLSANDEIVSNDAQNLTNRSIEAAVNMLRQDIGFVFQGFNLWEDRTVLGNLILAPTIVRGVSHEVAENRALQLCSQFGLKDKLRAKVWQLSGGQKQRVAIIRALMMEPKLMLFDEITSALDPVLTVDVMQIIKELQKSGLTMVVVTHHIEFASSLCDRIMFLSEGRSLQLDTPQNIMRTPATPEVAKFLDILRAAR